MIHIIIINIIIIIIIFSYISFLLHIFSYYNCTFYHLSWSLSLGDQNNSNLIQITPNPMQIMPIYNYPEITTFISYYIISLMLRKNYIHWKYYWIIFTINVYIYKKYYVALQNIQYNSEVIESILYNQNLSLIMYYYTLLYLIVYALKFLITYTLSLINIHSHIINNNAHHMTNTNYQHYILLYY